MFQQTEQSLRCREHYESPVRKASHLPNSFIKIDVPIKNYPYFCCEIHEEEFEGEFQSEEENVLFCEDYEDLTFLNEKSAEDLKDSQLKDEVGVQCNEGMPVSLKYLSSMPIECSGAKIIVPKDRFGTLHDPLVILPRKASKIVNEESEDEGNYQCRHCFKLFITGQALGGHMSRKHPALR